MTAVRLDRLAALREAGTPRGLVSVCSAHPLVIEAALAEARDADATALVEATCNQVNQEGGYTGLTPADFRDRVHAIADAVGLAHARIVLGGDHLGPNPWRRLEAREAMARAGDMIEAYAAAGYGKLHLDCSMGCAGEPEALPDETTAERAALLAGRAERAASAARAAPLYVIGTEIPTPGGATHALDTLAPTTPDAVRATYAVHERAFSAIPQAWRRVIAIVVQPGVEFGHDSVIAYRPEAARGLTASLADLPGLVFEAHSTDYQPERCLASLVADGFPILKVGPALTFALREALYGLDAIAGVFDPAGPRLADSMERLMLAAPGHWRSHYHGDPTEQRILRHYSYSDRIRYYWPEPAAEDAVADLFERLGDGAIAPTLISQHLPRLYERVADGTLEAHPRALALAAIRDVLASYRRACEPRPTDRHVRKGHHIGNHA